VVEGAHAADLGLGNDRYLIGAGSCLGVDLGEGDDYAGGSRELWGGTGDCVIRGGPGDDTISWTGSDAPGGPADTTLLGGRGNDVLRGGNDTVTDVALPRVLIDCETVVPLP
jgi:Ca2+-binding RTX toxin-like protein